MYNCRTNSLITNLLYIGQIMLSYNRKCTMEYTFIYMYMYIHENMTATVLLMLRSNFKGTAKNKKIGMYCSSSALRTCTVVVPSGHVQ